MTTATQYKVKPWFWRELERVTREPWGVVVMPHSIKAECRHGFLVGIPYPVGLDRPFLNDEAERDFVSKVLRAHKKDYGK